MSDDDSDDDSTGLATEEEPEEVLCSDLWQLIMTVLLERRDLFPHVDDVSPVMLALTCKREWRRYVRLAGPNPLTFRELYVRHNDGFEGYWNYKTDTYILRGEKGFSYVKKDHQKSMAKIERSELYCPMKRREQQRVKKERRFVKTQWKKGIYE